jgi:hypothetical protein
MLDLRERLAASSLELQEIARLEYFGAYFFKSSK